MHIVSNSHQDFALRYAAALSLRGFAQTVFQHTTRNKSLQLPNFVDVLFTLYDAMNDDDDEVRSIAAQATSCLLVSLGTRCPVLDPVPIVAQQMIAKYVVNNHGSNGGVVFEALKRLTSSAGFTPASTRLESVMENDDALFAVEKQNLYIDEARESFFWGRVLMHLEPHASSLDTIRAFTRWTVDGIKALIAQTEVTTDGALDWTSKPEAFALGMRVIRAAEVVLEWRSKRAARIKVRASEVRRALRQWADVGYDRELHPFWLEAIEEVLARSVEMKVLMVGRAMLGTGLC